MFKNVLNINEDVVIKLARWPACLSVASLGLLGLLEFDLDASLFHGSLGLEAHDATAPLSLRVLIELELEVLLQRLELVLVFLVDRGEGNDGGGLHVGQSAETSLALDNGEGDIHLAAKSRKPDDKLDGGNIVGDHNELCLLVLDQGGDVLQAELEEVRGWATVGRGSIASNFSCGLGLLTLGFGSLGLGLVLDEQLEEFSSLVLVKGLGELVDSRGHLQTLKKNLLLSLDANISGPSHET